MHLKVVIIMVFSFIDSAKFVCIEPAKSYIDIYIHRYIYINQFRMLCAISAGLYIDHLHMKIYTLKGVCVCVYVRVQSAAVFKEYKRERDRESERARHRRRINRFCLVVSSCQMFVHHMFGNATTITTTTKR